MKIPQSQHITVYHSMLALAQTSSSFKDYFLKMDWEVHICSLHESSYRPAEELITEAAHDHEQSLGITISLVLL